MKKRVMRLILIILGLAVVAVVIIMSEAFSPPVKLGESLAYGDATITVDDSGFSSQRNNVGCVARGQGFPYARVQIACSAGASEPCSLSLMGQVEHEDGTSWGGSDRQAKAVLLQPGEQATVGFGVQGCWNLSNRPKELILRIEDTGGNEATRRRARFELLAQE